MLVARGLLRRATRLVVDDEGHVPQARGTPPGRNPDHNRYVASILANRVELPERVVDRPLTTAPERLAHFGVLRPVVARNKILDRQARHLTGSVSEQPFGTPIHLQDAPPFIRHHERVWCRVDKAVGEFARGVHDGRLKPYLLRAASASRSADWLDSGHSALAWRQVCRLC